ncbi:MAG TPA: SLC13 family permease [Kiritimatiellia bacterium]|nr:SLC13 family permease [Kiritimatiellia bacterium]HRZ12980.1 SLC13 family permease [Kiritimatiellia bacterium]HSA18410.1 SLC13 family permease [Kiritimatiellia bacterium]
MKPSLVPVIIFILCYALFVVLPKRRSWIALGGGALLVLTGSLGWRTALTETIQWNVIALFFGTLVLAEMFMQSRMPAVMAEFLVDRTRTVRGALLAVCALSGGLSMFVENVAVVLLVAPVALSLSDKLKLSPVPLLIAIAISSNLQGTATLIGDPPSMILGGYMKMSFNDFFVYQGKPGIFFAVQVGALASLAVLAWQMRAHREPTVIVPQERIRSRVPGLLMLALILGLSVTSVFDPDFKWLAGTLTLVLAAVGLLWYRFRARWQSLRELVGTLDWDTTLFLIGVFVLVGGLSESGWLDVFASWISAHLGGCLFGAFAAIVLVSVALSAFVDNVPFLLAMIPVVQKVADHLEAPVPVLMFGLLIGACLGGNITPIGASANVVAIGLLRKRGYVVTFREFMAVGVPFTVAAVIAACAFTWWVWAP